MSETRKVAATLVSDVIRYSRFPALVEDRTPSRLRGPRSDLIDPAVAGHPGRVAIEARDGMVERNPGVTEDRPTEFCVGIHLGDVVEQPDGVNIAVGYARKASTTLASDRVGTTRASRNPALARRTAYSASVRSCPPIITSIAISNILPRCGASPGGSTISMINSGAVGFMALRQCPRIVRH
jgi:hypothetical protein